MMDMSPLEIFRQQKAALIAGVTGGLVAAILFVAWRSETAQTRLLAGDLSSATNAIASLQRELADWKGRCDAAREEGIALKTKLFALERDHKQVETMRLRFEERLHEAYPYLKKYERGVNVVNDRFFKDFEIDHQGKCHIRMENDTDAKIGPVSYRIDFLDAAGFCCGSVGASWVFDTIRPGERRTEHESAGCTRDQPVYYVIRHINP